MKIRTIDLSPTLRIVGQLPEAGEEMTEAFSVEMLETDAQGHPAWRPHVHESRLVLPEILRALLTRDLGPIAPSEVRGVDPASVRRGRWE